MICSVHLYGTRIGALSYKDKEPSLAYFEYDSHFLKSGIQVSPMHLPLSKQVFKFDNISARTFKGLPGVFCDSLPDSFGNQLIDQHLASRGKKQSDITAIDRLLYVGQRAMGALEYQPAIDMHDSHTGVLDVNLLSELSQLLLDKKSKFSEALNQSQNSQTVFDLLRIGTSAGGARAKALVSIDQRNGQVVLPNLTEPNNYKHYVLKFDGVANNQDRDSQDPLGMTVVEYIYSIIAKQCGINMTQCHLLESFGQRHFLIERFDRVIYKNKVDKLHYASWCGLAHAHRDTTLSYSYEQLVMLMRSMNLPQSDIEELFKRAVFNIVGRNQDDHTKNFGFLMDRQGQWSLSPAFDLTYAYDPNGRWTKTHQISLNDKGADFVKDDLIEFGAYCNLSSKESKSIIEKTINAFSDFSHLAKLYSLSKDLKHTVETHLRLKF